MNQERTNRMSQGLSLIGRERAIANSLTKELHTIARRHGYKPIVETRRGCQFDVQTMVKEGRTMEETGHVFRVTVELLPRGESV